MKTQLIYDGNHVFVQVGEEKRHVGEIKGKTLVVERDREKHLMKKWNSYGFNSEIIDNGTVTAVVIKEKDGNNFLITADNVKTFARIHQEEGWDKQYFIGLEHLTKL
jgi:hypothetical protein